MFTSICICTVVQSSSLVINPLSPHRVSGMHDMKRYRVSLTLNPKTANPHLVISANLKNIRYVSSLQNHSKPRKRFDRNFCVLASQGFTSGHWYWEVRVPGGGPQGTFFGEWKVGIATEPFAREGLSVNSTKNKCWAIRQSYVQYYAVSAKEQYLGVIEDLQVIGVFLDCENQVVYFCNAQTQDLLSNFRASCSEKLFPYFCLKASQGIQLLDLSI